jgi:hypothetical protein
MSAYVGTVLEIFRPPVPQRMGSASFDAAGVMSVGSLIAANPTQSGSKDFDNVFEYFDFLITLKQQVMHLMKPENQPGGANLSPCYSVMQIGLHKKIHTDVTACQLF